MTSCGLFQPHLFQDIQLTAVRFAATSLGFRLQFNLSCEFHLVLTDISRTMPIPNARLDPKCGVPLSSSKQRAARHISWFSVVKVLKTPSEDLAPQIS